MGPAMAWLGDRMKFKDRKANARILNASDEIMTNILIECPENGNLGNLLNENDDGNGESGISHDASASA